MISSSQSSKSAEVRYIDQQQINEFGLLSNSKTELREEIEEIKKQIDLLEDAEEAFMLNMGDVPSFSKLLVGETFVNVSDEEGQAFVESELEKKKNELSEKEAELESVLAKQAELKKVLYGRFGSSINLED